VIHFVVVVGAPAAVEREARRLSDALEATRLHDGERIAHVAPSRTWAVAAISAPDRVCASRLAVDGDAMIVANGPMLAATGEQAGLIDGLLRRFRTDGSGGVADALAGSYNCVGIAPGIGARAFADFSGLCPVYWATRADCSVFSNRSSTIAHLLDAGWNLHAFAWVIGHANLFDDDVPAAGVAYLPPGREARVGWGDHAVAVERSSTWIWPEPSNEPARDNLDDGEWDEITAAMVASFRSMRALDGPLRLWITGGKDSRLCLALAHAAGLRDHVETITAGTHDSPEVECAATVAAAVGFAHRRQGPPAQPNDGPPPAPPPFDADKVWRNLRQDVYRYEGIICAWSALQNTRAPQFNIKGFGGELYRRGNAKQFGAEIEDLDELARKFVNYHQIHDPLGVLRETEAAHQRSWLQNWVYDTARHVRLDVLPEKFYVDFRLGHWSGPLLQDAPVNINLNPLLLTHAARKNTELSVAARGSERFHFEVMRRAAPELVGLPFLNDVWAPAIQADTPVELAAEPFQASVTPTGRVLTGRNPGWRLMEHEEHTLARLFRDAGRRTAMGDICDVRKLRRVGRDAAQLKKSASVKELHSSIGVALALLGRAEPVLDPAT
jgi:hypothetical protein